MRSKRACPHLAGLGLILALLGMTAPLPAQMEEKKFEDFDKVVKGAKEYEGMFRLYRKEGRLYAEIPTHLLDKPLLCPISIARGIRMGGHTLNFGEQWVVVFRKVEDRLHLVRRNVRFQAKKNSPIARAVETTYTDSVLLSLRIQSIHPIRQGILINLNDVFMTDFAELGRGDFDASRSSWHKVKAFPRNIELEVAATYGRMGFGNDSVIDGRGTTVVIHYGLCQLPDDGYQPRLADDRVGYFLSTIKDFSSDNKDTSFLRYVNRWRLERAEPISSKTPNKLSPPKKKIVFWIENSVPDEYRQYVREGILEWNKAFEKIGFRDAIEVRQQENEDFDPEDINYNTFRWVANDEGYAMGPSRANPLTGELMDADIIFDASMVRFYRQEAKLFGNQAAVDAHPISPIQAARQGLGLLELAPLQRGGASEGWNDRPLAPQEREAQARWKAVQSGFCQCGPSLRRELHLAAMTLLAREEAPGDDKSANAVMDELIGQAIKEVTMHEVGHTLGLRHNFKASTMLKNEELHDTGITRKRGLVGSVMDYNPINLAPHGVKQGDYFTTTIGPYDYWAIEYAYKPLSGGTEGEHEKLQEIASRSAEPGHDYGTDEDLWGTHDPLIHQWDLGSDPMKFAQDRILLAEELLKKLSDKAGDKGDGYQRVRQGFGVVLQEFGNGAFLIANHVGGVYYHRDHRGDPNGRDPMVPVKGDKQREALKFLQEHILGDRHFQFAPQLLRRLAADRWSHWGNERVAMRDVEFPIHDRILAIQDVVLRELLDGRVLARIQNSSLRADKDDKPLKLAEVFRSLTEGVWNEVPAPEDKERKVLKSSIVRRNLQREYLKHLNSLVLGTAQAPPDARSLARMHLREIIGKIDTLLVVDKQVVLDDTTRAHLEECKERAVKVLNAPLQASER